jgi:hypothetical protein
MYFCVVLCIVCFVTYSVLFVCIICVLNYCHRVATQMQLNISYIHFTVAHHTPSDIQRDLQSKINTVLIRWLLTVPLWYYIAFKAYFCTILTTILHIKQAAPSDKTNHILTAKIKAKVKNALQKIQLYGLNKWQSEGSRSRMKVEGLT